MPNLVPEQEPACLSVAEEMELSPSQQLALLSLHRDELAAAVVAQLSHSTIRASADDCVALIARKLAYRTRKGAVRLTYIGLCAAVPLTRALAQLLDVELPRRPARRSSRNSLIGPGFSQAGNG